MKGEQLEKYIFDARASKRADVDIRQELIVGGWDPIAIDMALKSAESKIVKTQAKIDATLTVPQPNFFPGFLPIFVTLLILFNVITYWGQITAAPNTTAVSNFELIGGLVMCFIATLILSGIYSLVKKIRKSPSMLFSGFPIIFVILLVIVLVITFSGQIMGSENAMPVRALDVVGGIVMSLIGAAILTPIYRGIRKLISKVKNKK